MSEIIIKIPDWMAIILSVAGAIYVMDRLYEATKQAVDTWKKK